MCDDHWSIANADVVCRELNCGTVLDAKKGAFFGEGQNRIWLDDVQCTGHEPSVLKCPHRPMGENNCHHSEDAGVVCSGKTGFILIVYSYFTCVCFTTTYFKLNYWLDTTQIIHFVPLLKQ